MRKLTRYVIVILCIVLALSGCAPNESQSASTQLPGGGQSPASNSSNMPQSSQQSETGGQMIEPKQLISKEEAAQLIGEAVKDGSADEQPMLGMKVCLYTAENSASKGYLQVVVIQAGSLQQGQQQSSGNSGGSSGGSGGSSESSQSSPSSSPSSSAGSELTPKGIFEALKHAMEDLNSGDTGRVGDDNFLTAQGMGILSGEYYIFVSAGSNDVTALPGIVKTAGELAIRNLKRIQGK